jgi:hypothetical protein
MRPDLLEPKSPAAARPHSIHQHEPP